MIEQLSREFDEWCQQRHNKGQEEYGTFTFLGADTVEMMLEELADAANYARYHFIKLRLLQMRLAEELDEESTEAAEAFRRAGDIFGN
jgi:hypothetical protein